MIHGFFDPRSPDWPIPYVSVLVYVDGITPSWAQVNFLLDTGATTSCIHPLDSVRSLGLPVAQLATPPADWVPEISSGIGGSSSYYRHPATYALRHDDGQWDIFGGQLRIGQITAQNTRIPSLLGWDVLQQFQLVTNWPSRLISLERLVPPAAPVSALPNS